MNRKGDRRDRLPLYWVRRNHKILKIIGVIFYSFFFIHFINITKLGYIGFIIVKLYISSNVQ